MDLSVEELAARIARRDTSSVEAVEASFERIRALDPEIGAFTVLDEAGAISAARAADQEIAGGHHRGSLHGVPVGIKDLVFTEGIRTVGGSPIYTTLVPDNDDIAVERLREAGAVIVGKTNVAEFGFGVVTRNSVFGVTRNPWDTSRTPGGSSGGSAAAVAAGMVPFAIASDGGGSIRAPSSYCGIVGLKPTFGVVPLYPSCRDTRYPGLGAWESLEHIGPMTRTVRDAALVMDAIAGPDPRDRHSRGIQGTFTEPLERDWSAIRVGWTTDIGTGAPLDADVRAVVVEAADALAKRGAAVEEAPIDLSAAFQAFGPIVALDADLAAMRKLIDENPDVIDERLVSLMQMERTAVEMSSAVARRKDLFDSARRYLERYDLLLTPATPVPAWDVERNMPELIGGRPVTDVREALSFTLPFNLTGHPAASVPSGVADNGLPLGVQIVGSLLQDVFVLEAARALEQSLPWDERRPELALAR